MCTRLLTPKLKKRITMLFAKRQFYSKIRPSKSEIFAQIRQTCAEIHLPLYRITKKIYKK